MSDGEVFVECMGHDHIVGVHWHDDESEFAWAYLNVYMDNYYWRQESWLRRIRRRAALIWSVMWGRDFLLDEVALSREDAMRLAKALNNAPSTSTAPPEPAPQEAPAIRSNKDE